MNLKENECFELVITDMCNAKTVAGLLLNEGYSVQITPVIRKRNTDHALLKEYLVTIRQGLNKIETDYDMVGINE